MKKNIPTSSICSEDYFYDRDGKIENSLAAMEIKWSSALENVLKDNFTTDDIERIREFVVYQIGRTKAMLLHNKEIGTSFVKGILKQSFGKTIDGEALEDFIDNEITPELGLAIAKKEIPTIQDLKMKVITNETEMSFITSDVPVIVVNPWRISSAGLCMIGEVIFFPISPRKMIFFYDAKFYGKLPDRICDESVIEIFNQYQYVSADERLLSKDIKDINHIINNEELISKREQFQKTKKTDNIGDGEQVGIFFVAKARSIPYYYNIPILCLPKMLRKIPADFRETFSREYSYKTRKAILCRIYRDPDFIDDKKLKKHWKKHQMYSNKLLDYLDNYWNTPKDHRVITPKLMNELKNVPVKTFMNEKYKY